MIKKIDFANNKNVLIANLDKHGNKEIIAQILPQMSPIFGDLAEPCGTIFLKEKFQNEFLRDKRFNEILNQMNK